jgi:hypothetical protein
LSVRDVEPHADTSLTYLHGPRGLVSRIGKPLYVVDGMDIGVVHTHVSRLTLSQQEPEEREECQHLSKVSIMNTLLSVNAYVALDQVQDLYACQTTIDLQYTDLHRNDHPFQVCPPLAYLGSIMSIVYTSTSRYLDTK